MVTPAQHPVFARREEYVPPAIVGKPNATVIILHLPEPKERERLTSTLFRLGVNIIGMDTIRASMIEALYEFHEDVEADRLATFLDTYWTSVAAFSAALEEWQSNEVFRLLQAAGGFVQNPAEPQPVSSLTVRERARATTLIDGLIHQSPALRALTARHLSQDFELEAMQARLSIKGVMPGPGAEEPFPLEIEGDEEKITEESLGRIREHIGERAWQELAARVAALFHPPAREDERLTEAVKAERPENHAVQ